MAMNESKVNQQKSAEKVELSINIDSRLLDQVQHLTNDPSKVIESALDAAFNAARANGDVGDYENSTGINLTIS